MRPYAWIDASGGTDVGFDGDDDNFVGPLALGFDFGFYENTYSDVYISTNGVVSFGSGTRAYENTLLPRIGPPNNFIAPFWDDLAVGGFYNSGAVYTLAGEESGEKYFVIQWDQVTRKGTAEDPLTFEIILYEDGDACVQYHTMNGSLTNATVGIEDIDGVEASLYRYNSEGIGDLVGNHALCFDRPIPAPRVKVLPYYEARFAQNYRAEFTMEVRNTGENGPDTYDISYTQTGEPWTVEILSADGQTPLVDTDGDSFVDSGSLSEGESATVIVRLIASETALEGEYSRLNVQAQSSLDAGQIGVAVFQSAIPGRFSQIYTDSQTGMHMQFFRDDGSHKLDVSGDFTGSTLTLAGSPNGNFIYSWERRNVNPQSFVLYSDIEYVIYDDFGSAVTPPTKLTNHHTVNDITLDHSPALAVLPNGNTGVIWVQDIYNQTLDLNSNVYFAILDTDGNITQSPLNITQNTAWRGSGNFDVPQFTHPQVAAAGKETFILAWVDDRLQSTGDTSDIVYAAYSAESGQMLANGIFAESVPGGIRYLDPNLSSLSGDHAILAYAALNPATADYEVSMGILDSLGNVIRAGAPVAGAQGRNVDTAQLSTGEILLAWIETQEYVLNYLLLDGTTYDNLAGPYEIQSPFDRQADNPSVAADLSGNAVLSWMDAEYNDYLYYSLVDASGATVTPAMVFLQGDAEDPQIITSWAGAGNAPYLNQNIYMPILMR